ncbi:lacr bacterial regulatory protein hth signature [Lucifera butyrica]|uniref:Lacr bacterial regulatory protein hth signature n=1 Tax=Lucifera butyrica TaxID=1351585 RepID=A0A498R8Y7_9FIRM|nr:DeoR/GlpR family DNA-binding transcription regulator [Lucifera butyrica]VBB06603.1 lacr bacterial regulatory protein hth signature [Lucifera butyrica]
MLGIERRQKITERIQRDRKVYVSTLSELFGVTEETVRRDLEKLENEGILSRTYGGAISNQHTNEDLSFPARTSLNFEAKQLIAAKAAALINDRDTIMVDASTTCLELMHALKEKKGLTVITNSVKITHDFMDANFNIISTGGSLRSHSCALVGPVAVNTLANYYVDVAVISCKGLSLAKGIMESNEPESEFKKRLIQQAGKTILLADHTKFNKTAFVKLMDFAALDYIVTDQAPAGEWLELFNKYNIKVLY